MSSTTFPESYENVRTTFSQPTEQTQHSPSSSQVRFDVQRFALRADTLAHQIIQENEPAEGVSHGPTIIHHHYVDPWYYPQPSIFVSSSSCDRRDRKKNDDGLVILLGITSVVVGAIALVALGSAIPRRSDASSELADTLEFQHKISRVEPTPQDEAIIRQALAAAEIKANLCARIKDKAEEDIILRGALLGSCVAVGAGLALSTPAAVTAGVVTSLIVGGAMLFKWGFDSSDKRNLMDAVELRASVLRMQSL